MTMDGSSPFLTAFGLRDNPFNPLEFGDVEPWALDNLSSAPLPLDEEPRLRPLFKETLKSFDALLAGKKYSMQPPALGTKSLFIKITGKRGTGKTTLANEMVRRLKQCAAKDADIEVYRVEGHYISPSDFEDQIGNLHEQVAEHLPARPCIILDDAPYARWTIAEDLYNKIRNKTKTPVIIILILSDVEALRRPVRIAGKYGWYDFATTNLTAHQAVALVAQRVRLFRPDPLQDHLARLGMELFPFDPRDIEKCVAPAQGGLDDPGTITLRQLHLILERSLEEMLGEFMQMADLTRTATDELRGRLISLKREYLREIEAALRDGDLAPESIP